MDKIERSRAKRRRKRREPEIGMEREGFRGGSKEGRLAEIERDVDGEFESEIKME